MKKWIILPVLALCLGLTGCAVLLERSSSVVEPYTDRYWETGAEDTLRAENHQELVNTLLLLVEERAEEGIIRCYTDQNAYFLGYTASEEVMKETVLGSYLLDSLDFTYELGDGYCTLTYKMTYREDAESVEGLMRLSDCQSLADLLRVALREGHQKLTARFVYKTPRDDISAAVEALWQELYRATLPPPLRRGPTPPRRCRRRLPLRPPRSPRSPRSPPGRNRTRRPRPSPGSPAKRTESPQRAKRLPRSRRSPHRVPPAPGPSIFTPTGERRGSWRSFWIIKKRTACAVLFFAGF